MSHASVLVRQAGDADVPRIADLLGGQFAEHRIAMTVPALRGAARGLLADPRRGFILVAVEGGTLVGIAVVVFVWTLEHGGPSAWLDELYVQPDARGRGVGTRLASEALAAAVRAGCAAVDLEVDRGHEAVERLYARMGFRPLARRRWMTRLSTPPIRE